MDLVKACDNRLKDAQDTIAKIVDDNGEKVTNIQEIIQRL